MDGRHSERHAYGICEVVVGVRVRRTRSGIGRANRDRTAVEHGLGGVHPIPY